MELSTYHQNGQKNVGDEVDKTKHMYIDSMKRSVERKLQSIKKKPATVAGKAAVLSNTLYSPFELIAHHEQQQKEKQDMIETKRKAKEVKEAAKVAKKIAQTCLVDTCDAHTRVAGGTKGWFCCNTCQKLFCKKHKAEYETHVATCSEEGSGNFMGEVESV